jgi:hypothetical protein
VADPEPGSLADLDAAVGEARADGLSMRAIARILGVDRGRVARSVRRLERAKAPPTLARVEPEPTADDAPDVAGLLVDVEREIAAALTTGDSVNAGRWSRVRVALLAKAPPAAPREAFDLSRLSRAGNAALALVHYELGALPAGHIAVVEAEAAKAAIEGTLPAKGERCALCYCDAEVAARRWTCEACADIAIRLRSGLPIVEPGETAIGVAPLLSDGDASREP